MADFKLISDFEPKGDQPQAIEELTDGIRKGLRDQTLLGVTGSGKSLDGDEPVLVYQRIRGRWIPDLLPIGRFVEERLRERQTDGQVGEWGTLSVNPKNLKVAILPISDFLRHEAPDFMWEVTTDCGREVVLTGDHNLWVLREGNLKLIETSELRRGDYLPLPLEIPLSKEPLSSFDIFGFFSHHEVSFFVQAPLLLDKLQKVYGKNKIREHLKKYYPDSHREKWHAIENELKGSGFSSDVFLSFLDSLSYNLTEDDLEKTVLHVGGKYRLPFRIPLTHDWMRLFGWYIAEGHATDRFVILSIREPFLQKEVEDCLHRLDLSCSLRPDGDFQISNKLVALLLSLLCGTCAWNKKLPPFWPQLSKEQLGFILAAYFDGGGSAETASLVCATASKKLSEDLLYAFSTLGIWARRQVRFKRAYNSNHDGNFYQHVTVSGQANVQQFYHWIPLQNERKKRRLRQLLQKRPHSNVDVIPVNPGDLFNLRKMCGVYSTSIPWLTHSAISLFESGKRRPKRDTLERLLKHYAENFPGDLTRSELYQKLKNTLSCRWARVRLAAKILYRKPYVYDLSVPSNETFLGGRSGLFVHNTFTMAHVIANVGRPTLVIAPNKTLAAQLFGEFKELFPENAVEYFVSYYDYYQPEAYVPAKDLFIEKDSSINEDIDKLRHAATRSLLERNDVIIVASVSCIYGLGSPEAYHGMLVFIEKGREYPRQELLKDLVKIQYERNDYDFHRTTFRVRGDVVEIFPAHEDSKAVRVEFFGDEIDKLSEIDPLRGNALREIPKIAIYPASHYVTPKEQMERARISVKEELQERLKFLHNQGKLLEAQRLEQRTQYDLEMMEEIGFCKGIENYSRHLTGQKPGQPPPTLLDYYPDNFLLIIDESHITVPQIGGMYHGDFTRKQTLVEYGFRLPSALDNRPLKFAEFEERAHQVIYTSATPADYELKKSEGVVVEQIIRPTGLIDPEVEVRPVAQQVEDLEQEIRLRVERKERVLITTLTKKMAEDLTEYYRTRGVRVKYLHSDVETLERYEILRELRLGGFDVLVGINLLREGLNLPEVSLVAILDADKEGFLRSARSLIQTFGRAARNVNARVILYADKMTDSMKQAMGETNRRRKIQSAYNKKHGITPKTVKNNISNVLHSIYEKDYVELPTEGIVVGPRKILPEQIPQEIERLKKEMKEAAGQLEFEKAAELRDQIRQLREKELSLGVKV